MGMCVSVCVFVLFFYFFLYFFINNLLRISGKKVERNTGKGRWLRLMGNKTLDNISEESEAGYAAIHAM